MGGIKAQTVGIAAALCGALALVLPGTAAAAASVPALPVVEQNGEQAAERAVAAVPEPVTQVSRKAGRKAGRKAAHEAGAVARDLAAAPAPVRESRDRNASPSHGQQTVSQAPSSSPGSERRTLAPAGKRSTAAPRREADARSSHGADSSPRAAQRTSPPHGRKATPPARSLAGRAGTARTAPPQDRAPSDAGLAGAARAFTGPGGIAFVALVVAALAASAPFLLRPNHRPAPVARRLAFVSPGEPPG
jgi:hypothetical protein